MTKKWIAINILLLATAGVLGWRLHKSVLQFYAVNDLSKIQPVRDIKQKMPQEQLVLKPVPAKVYNPADFAVISDKNVFSDLRAKEQKVVQPAAPPEPPPLAQKPILVGITISGDQQFASIIDPTAPTAPNQSRRAQIKRIGDSYSGYLITEIDTDRIVLQSGTRKEIIPLHEGTKRTQHVRTPVQASRVLSFGGSGSGGTATTVVSTQPVTPARPAVTNTPTPPPRPAAAPAQQASPQAAPGSKPRRVVKTPFGEVVIN